MIPPKAMQVLFATVGVIFVFTLITHVSNQDESDMSSDSFTSRVSGKLKPFFSGGSTGLQEHLKRSEKIYTEMIGQRQGMMEQYPNPANKDLFPCNSGSAYWSTPFSIWDFVPASFNCPHSIHRLGRLGDGGKWLCGLEKHVSLPPKSSPKARPSCVIYSFGIQTESSFEEELLQRTPNCEIWGYDFSVSKFGPQLHEVEAKGRAHFTQAGIAGTTDANRAPPFYSIQDLMSMNGHDHIDILKMDIEGYEFESMRSVIKHFFAIGNGEVPIAQFLVEIHLDPNRIGVDDFMKWWELLEEAGFRPVWTEPNLLVTTIPLHDGKPRYAEYTFINIQDSKSPLLR